MKVVKKIFTIIIYTILILLVSFNLYNGVCINVFHQDIATINGYGMLEVVSGSMEPTIKVGDLIIINTKDMKLSKDDIITFYDNGSPDVSFVTHRIVELNGKEVITKGDNNNAIDQNPILQSDVVGKYVTRINGAGRLMSSLKSPFVMFMILLIGIMVCYLVSTDKEGNPIITEEEKEFIEFREYKKEQEKKKKKTTKKK